MIIGITGTLGAGKGTVVEYLVSKKGFKHYSASGFITEEILRRGLPVNRDTMRETADNLRQLHGPDYIMTELLARAKEAGGDAIIESVRAVGEAQYLKSHGAVLWAVDADVRVRYERIVKRKSEKDAVTFEHFVEQEKKESDNEEPYKMNLPKCIALADKVFYNEGAPEELFAQVEAALK
jgi:dephospho-CoA kinase